jgi:hypothetical protein
VRGSHRWGFFKPNVFVSQMAFPGADGDTLPDIDGNEADYDIESYELEPGDMLGHHHLTVRLTRFPVLASRDARRREERGNGSTRPRCSKPPRLSS